MLVITVLGYGDVTSNITVLILVFVKTTTVGLKAHPVASDF